VVLKQRPESIERLWWIDWRTSILTERERVQRERERERVQRTPEVTNYLLV
jgi:hypothetical protein